MTEDNLKYLKEKVSNWNLVKKDINALERMKNRLLAEKSRLEEDFTVRQYIKIMSGISKHDEELDKLMNEHKDWNWDEDKLIENSAFSSVSNGIYVCMGGYPAKKGTYIERNNCFDYLVPDNTKILDITDESVFYRIYWDIERGLSYVREDGKILGKYEWQLFENNHIILFPTVDDKEEFFKQVRLLFLKTCISDGQEEAIQKVLSIKDSKSI